MSGLLARFRSDEGGSYLVMFALALPVLIGGAGFGVDVGLWLFKRQSLQAAADSGAISVANAVKAGEPNLLVQAEAVTANYGFVDGQAGVSVAVNKPPTSGTHTTTSGAVEVIVRQSQPRAFTALWRTGKVPVSARAVAIPAIGDGCVLALSRTASSSVSAQGSSSVSLSGCSLIDNSSSATAVNLGGSATISALSAGIVGGISGASSLSTTEGISTGISPIADPYASAYYPPYSGCNQTNYTAKATVTLSPGVYCQGLSLNAGAVVTLSPGIYYLDRGSLSVNGGATLTGTDVTLVFTSSTGSNYATATVNGGAVVNLTAPKSGPTAGIVIFGDRSMPAGTSFKFNGGASQTFGGAIYAPKGDVSFAGGSGTGAGCTQLIGDTVSFVGNSNFKLDCDGYGTESFGAQATLLVE